MPSSSIRELLDDPRFEQGVADAPTLLDYAKNPRPGNFAGVVGLIGRLLSEQLSGEREDMISLGVMPAARIERFEQEHGNDPF